MTDNPFEGRNTAPVANTSLISIEQQRALGEVQARVVMARTNPRDPRDAMDRILEECRRTALAEDALYQYNRGGSDVSGPSIRLMETIAQQWGNIECGFKVIGRHNGMSDCIAFAWDLERNFRDSREFQVPHIRERKGGKSYRLTDERDIYEMEANWAQRRKRAALMAVIPRDVQDTAQKQCEETLHASADTSPEAVATMVEFFVRRFSVTREMIEKRIGRRLDAIGAAQVLSLRRIALSLRDEMSQISDWFEVPAAAQPEEPGADLPDIDPELEAEAARRAAAGVPMPVVPEPPARPAEPASPPQVSQAPEKTEGRSTSPAEPQAAPERPAPPPTEPAPAPKPEPPPRPGPPAEAPVPVREPEPAQAAGPAYYWDGWNDDGEPALYEFHQPTQAVEEYRRQLERSKTRDELNTLNTNGASLREALRVTKHDADARMLDGVYGRQTARLQLAEERAATTARATIAAAAPPAPIQGSDLTVPYDGTSGQEWYQPAAAKLMAMQRAKAPAAQYEEFERANVRALNDLRTKFPPHYRMLEKHLTEGKKQ